MIMRRFAITIGVAATLMGQPLLAQDGNAPAKNSDAATASREDGDPMAAMADLFAFEPLTAEQEARLPLAREIIDKMVPVGSLGEVMGSIYDDLLTPIMQRTTQVTAGDVARPLGFAPDDLNLDQQQLDAAMTILDPARDERNARIAQVMPQVMQEVMVSLEPAVRTAMAEAYAFHFEEQELVDINSFFSTQSGLNFARKSLTMSSDPRIISASFEAFPAIMESLQGMEERIRQVGADLPAARGFDELSEQERSMLAEIIGISVAELADRASEY